MNYPNAYWSRYAFLKDRLLVLSLSVYPPETHTIDTLGYLIFLDVAYIALPFVFQAEDINVKRGTGDTLITEFVNQNERYKVLSSVVTWKQKHE